MLIRWLVKPRNLITALVGFSNLRSSAHTEHNLVRAPRGCVDRYVWNSAHDLVWLLLGTTTLVAGCTIACKCVYSGTEAQFEAYKQAQTENAAIYDQIDLHPP